MKPPFIAHHPSHMRLPAKHTWAFLSITPTADALSVSTGVRPFLASDPFPCHPDLEPHVSEFPLQLKGWPRSWDSPEVLNSGPDRLRSPEFSTHSCFPLLFSSSVCACTPWVSKPVTSDLQSRLGTAVPDVVKFVGLSRGKVQS